MLQAIREKAQGWIAWAIVILISIPFALWGIQEYLGVGGEPEVAVVDGEAITERMLEQRTRDFRETIRSSLGDSYRADLFEEAALKRQALDAIVEEMVLLSNATDWNLRTSDHQARAFIASIPAFQRDGQFDQLAYETAVRNRGMTRAGFEQRVRQDLTMSQLRSGVLDTAFVTRSDLETRVRLRDQQRTIAWLRIPREAFLGEVEADQAAVREFYDNNLERYRTPEKLRLRYLLLEPDSLSGLVEVSEEALRDYFENHRSEFVAREERAVRHILLAVPPSAGEDEALVIREQADSLLERLRAGADFKALAEEYSDDPGSAAAGGDLGLVERGLMVPAFEEAAFALAEGEMSDVVRTDFGFHIIQVTGIRGGSDADFADLRDKVETAYRKFEAESLYFDYAERLAESAYENSSSLLPAAEALGLELHITDWITRGTRLAAPLDSPKVVNIAFSEDVLVEAHNSELIEVGPQTAVVLRVAEHQPAGFKSFDENQAAIEQDYRQTRASELAAEAGRRLLAGLRDDGRSLEQVASERDWRFVEPLSVERNQSGVPAEVLAEAFALQPPQKEQPAYAGVVAAEGDYFLLRVSEVQGGSLVALPDAGRAEVTEQIVAQIANAQFDAFVDSLRERTPVELIGSELQ